MMTDDKINKKIILRCLKNQNLYRLVSSKNFDDPNFIVENIIKYIAVNNLKFIEDFNSFLKKNKAYKKYFKNLKDYRFGDDKYYLTLPFYNLINGAFNWNNTKEGLYFWNELHIKWYMYLTQKHKYVFQLMQDKKKIFQIINMYNKEKFFISLI